MKVSFISIVALFLIANFAHSQGQLIITTNGRIVCSGAPQIVLNNTKLNNSGTFTAASSKVQMVGNATTTNSAIQGSATTTFYNLEINKSSNDVQLESDINVSNQMTFINGKFNLGSKKVTLSGTTSTISGEKETSRYTNSTTGTGTAELTRNLNNPSSVNPGNIGTTITAPNTNLGSTVISRGHKTFTLSSGTSIQRFYKITPTNNLGGTLRLSYFDAELNGLAESNLDIWRSTNNGTTWTKVTTGTKTSNATQNWVQRTGFTTLSGMYTLGKPTAFASDGDNGEDLMDDQSIDELSAPSAVYMNVFPNPTNGEVEIQIQSDREEQSYISWYTASGQLVKKEAVWLVIGRNSFTMSIAELPVGLYFVDCEKLGVPAFQVIKQ